MKLQTLTVLFIIIILPITITVSRFIDSQIAEINRQTNYDSLLTNATYDAMEAFQINESSSSTSDIATEKMRDVKASVESFYNSLASAMSSKGYTSEELKDYTPCLLYGLYDGYYIYTKYWDDEANESKYGLKPYVYYTEKISNGANNLTITYTLDNYVIVTGIMNNSPIAYSGYFTNSKHNVKDSEMLYENIDFGDEVKKNVRYIYQKFNVDGDETEEGQSLKYYHIDDNWYSYGADGKLKKEDDLKRIELLNSNGELDKSAKKYKDTNKKFSNFLQELEGYKNQDGELCSYFSLTNNDPDKYSSPFNEHRRNVIKKSIESNLERTLYNYRDNNRIKEFEMPEIDETHWDMIINNPCIISFMQGMLLKYKDYAGYSVVINTQSKDFVDPDEIYIIEGNNPNDNNTYHKIIWNEFKQYQKIIGAYRNIDFKIKKEYFSNFGEKSYYYSHADKADYESVIAATNVEMPNLEKNQNAIEVITELYENNTSTYSYLGEALKAYYTALYRERYVNYKSLNFGYNKP